MPYASTSTPTSPSFHIYPLLQTTLLPTSTSPIHYIHPFSSRSLTNKHFYNMEKKLQNFERVLAILQELYREESDQLKREVKEILFYQSQLKGRYERYEDMLGRLMEKRRKVGQLEDRNGKLEAQRKLGSSFLCSVAKYQEDQIENKQTEKREGREKVEQVKKKIAQKKKDQQNLSTQIQQIKQQKQAYLQIIGSFEKAKLQLVDQNQRLNHILSQQRQKNQQLHTTLQQQIHFQTMITTPINQLSLMKKSLHNKLQQLRGNIRVYCRIRPLTKKQTPTIYELKQHDLLLIRKSLEQQDSQNKKRDFEFVFDRIFDQQTSQQEVFGQISQLVQTAIDGFNVCIFAYGQTGSGKTFTMQGNSVKGKQSFGIIPRSTEMIFSQLHKLQHNGQQTDLDISINEIYNDQVVNLLTKAPIKCAKPLFTPTKSIEQVEHLLSKAISNRSTAFTLSNADSSRSHLIFIIRIRIRNVAQGQSQQKGKQSCLVLVDLAGSQRVKESGVSKERLKEAQHINSSLSHLGQVIRSLKVNKGKTNFRNSKLTYFLEPYLQNGSKAIMFVNISPSSSDQSQSINSLKFASIARQCRLQSENE